MAMVNCWECRKKFSDTLKDCPRCGAKRKIASEPYAESWGRASSKSDAKINSVNQGGKGAPAWVVAAGTGLTALFSMNAFAAVWALFLVLAVVSFIRPLKILGLRSRKAAFLSVLGLGGAFIIAAFADAWRMEILEENQPELHAKIKQERELAEAESDQAKKESESRERRLAKAEAEKGRRVESKKRLYKQEAEKIEARKKSAEEAKEREAGFHCLSAWDGSHNAFKRAVKERMRNPKSFEHIETRVAPVNRNGEHAILMTFRAENGFGGMTTGSAVGAFKNADCSYTIIRVE